MITAQEARSLKQELKLKQEAKRKMELEIAAFQNKDLLSDIEFDIKETSSQGGSAIIAPMVGKDSSDIKEVRDFMEYLSSLDFHVKLMENCNELQLEISW